MPSDKFKNSTYIPALNALAALVQWLKPGRLSFRFGQLKYAIEPVAVRIEKTHQQLIDDNVLWDIEEPKDENDKRSPDERPKKRRLRLDSLASGVMEFDMGSKRESFKAEYRKLMDDESEITFTRLISEDDIDAIEKNRIERPQKDASGNVIQLPPVDFAALIPFMEKPKAAKAEAAVGAGAGAEEAE